MFKVITSDDHTHHFRYNPQNQMLSVNHKAKQRKGVPIDKILHGQHLHLRDTIFPFWGNNEAGVSTGPGTEAYAATQQLGAEERNIEARRFLGLSAEDETEVIEIMNQFLTDGV
ncbi:hypothetical protein [Neptunomonas japonica]|uniref:hypothetical protein n=1 Tax=Neptunomonas japonica TaxID=417574 RepID=UPI0004101731|nr:hypothetical protein [Neptunomonas japonica]